MHDIKLNVFCNSFILYLQYPNFIDTNFLPFSFLISINGNTIYLYISISLQVSF